MSSQLRQKTSGKEVNFMYEKPKIVAVQKATDAIQGMDKTQGTVDILNHNSPFPSVAAYSSDE